MTLHDVARLIVRETSLVVQDNDDSLNVFVGEPPKKVYVFDCYGVSAHKKGTDGFARKTLDSLWTIVSEEGWYSTYNYPIGIIAGILKDVGYTPPVEPARRLEELAK